MLGGVVEKRHIQLLHVPEGTESCTTHTPDVEFVCADELVVNEVLLGELLGLLIHGGRMQRHLSPTDAVNNGKTTQT